MTQNLARIITILTSKHHLHPKISNDIIISRAVGSSAGVERPLGAMTEAAQWPIVFPRKARKNFSDLLFNGQETALVVSRYIEGHHACILFLSLQADIEHTARSLNIAIKILLFTCSMNQINVTNRRRW